MSRVLNVLFIAVTTLSFLYLTVYLYWIMQYKEDNIYIFLLLFSIPVCIFVEVVKQTDEIGGLFHFLRHIAMASITFIAIWLLIAPYVPFQYVDRSCRNIVLDVEYKEEINTTFNLCIANIFFRDQRFAIEYNFPPKNKTEESRLLHSKYIENISKKYVDDITEMEKSFVTDFASNEVYPLSLDMIHLSAYNEVWDLGQRAFSNELNMLRSKIVKTIGIKSNVENN